MTGRPIRLALVNDYEIVVAGFAGVLRPYSDRVEVVELDVDGGADENGDPVDIAVFDTFASPLDPTVEFATLLANPRIGKVVAYSFNEDESAVRDTMAAGVHGYISKAVPTERLVDALERIAGGEWVVELAAPSEPTMSAWPGQREGLTAREAEIVGLIAQGLSNEEIARLCYISINTVKSYIRAAYRKAGVSTRAQAVAWALRHGFSAEPSRPSRD
ncbi:response regulator transcription factor [Yimella sp. cx-51]|uniref:response regulator transcription factor n=1 Tax=Yimella sp. cx-51 TaxID=2770551 RepID=UPI00165E7078|nr:response regulator transcription factor [Yimella sp. cx-51]MBC9955493.1 response regulator transcription factor [Yimella sp. cx-51]QTH37921.1 response regulator transcription factor [Yimella sp. cx-51]